MEEWICRDLRSVTQALSRVDAVGLTWRIEITSCWRQRMVVAGAGFLRKEELP